MLLDTDVLEHYHAAHERDIEQLENLDTGDALAAADISLDTYQSFRRGLLGKTSLTAFFDRNRFPSVPRPSLAFIKHGYTNSEKLPDNAYGENARFMSHILFPMAGVRIGEPVAEVGLTGLDEVKGCKDAELFFVDTYRQLIDSTYRRDENTRPQDNITIFHSTNRQVLGMRKTYYEPSTLMLETTKSRGLWIPEATIVSVGITKARQTGSYSRDGTTVKSFAIDDQLMIAPIRVSAWAYPEQIDQALFSVLKNGYDSGRADTIASLTIDDFRESAQAALDECLSNGFAA